jgi:hypothetical protein
LAWRSRRWSTESASLTSRQFEPVALVDWSGLVVVDRFEREGVALVGTLWEGEFFRDWKGWECGFLAEENVCVFCLTWPWVGSCRLTQTCFDKCVERK